MVSNFQFDWTLNVGHFFTFVAFLMTAAGFYFSMRTDVKLVGKDVQIIGGRILNVENSISSINTMLIDQARIDERLHSLTAKSILQDQRIADLQQEINETRVEARMAAART